MSRANPVHYCKPPEITVWDTSCPHPQGHQDQYDMCFPRIVSRIPDGSKFTCDHCGKVQIVWTREGGHNRYIGWAVSTDWRDETWIEGLVRRWFKR